MDSHAGPKQATCLDVVRLYIVRHGETEDNKLRIAAGHNAGGLSQLGKLQAKILGVRLRTEPIDFVFCSDLRRTSETLEIIMQEVGRELPIVFEPRLREKHAGSLEGKKLGISERMAKAAGVPLRSFRPPGGESWNDVAARARGFTKDVLALCASSSLYHKYNQSVRDQQLLASNDKVQAGKYNLLLVTHGGLIKECDPGNILKNCSLTRIDAIPKNRQGSFDFKRQGTWKIDMLEKLQMSLHGHPSAIAFSRSHFTKESLFLCSQCFKFQQDLQDWFLLA
eukprot:602775-Hanusia_phi.AAC.1